MQYLNWIQIPLITSNKKDQMFSERNYCKHISVYNSTFYQQVLQSFSWFITISKETRSLVFCWFHRLFFSHQCFPYSTKIKVVILKLVYFLTEELLLLLVTNFCNATPLQKGLACALKTCRSNIVFTLFFLFPGQIVTWLLSLVIFWKRLSFLSVYYPGKETQQLQNSVIT